MNWNIAMDVFTSQIELSWENLRMATSWAALSIVPDGQGWKLSGIK